MAGNERLNISFGPHLRVALTSIHDVMLLRISRLVQGPRLHHPLCVLLRIASRLSPTPRETKVLQECSPQLDQSYTIILLPPGMHTSRCTAQRGLLAVSAILALAEINLFAIWHSRKGPRRVKASGDAFSSRSKG